MVVDFRRLIALVVVFSFSCLAGAQDEWEDVSRIVAVGDLHGDYQQFVTVMEMAGLLNEDGNWSGGKTHLVQTGDIPDRGPDSLKIITHLRKLDRQANHAGGMIHVLIGNHEAMNIYGDLRYVHPGEYKVLVNSRSKRLQERYYRAFIEHLAKNNPDVTIDESFKERWKEKYPLGYVEHRLKWEPGGEVADWVQKHNTVIRINDVLFLHGGINPHLPYTPIRKINRTIREELKSIPLPEGSLADSPDGPLWYRGLLQNPAETERPALVQMLEYYGAEHIVGGHTTTRGIIRPRFGDRVIAIDVGLSRAYGGRMACLVIEGENLYALHRGQKVRLPDREEKLPTYIRALGKIDPRLDTEEMLEAFEQSMERPIPESAAP